MQRVVLIGCGRHAELNHAPALAAYARAHPDEVELVAACHLDAQRARAVGGRHGFARAYDHLDEMLSRERPDDCVCVMPVPAIAAMATRLLEAGLPCTIEKPLGRSLAEARALREVAKRTGTPHMVSVDRRFNPWLARARQWALSRGPIRTILATMARHNRTHEHFITATAIHAVDALRHLAGEVVSFRAQRRREPELTGVWIHLELRFDSGIVARLDILPTAGRIEERYELYGEGYCAAASIPIGQPASLRAWEGGRCVVDETSPADTPIYLNTGAYEETAAFLQGCRSPLGPRPTVDQVLASLELCHELLSASGEATA